MKYDHYGCYISVILPPILKKNYEIPTNVTDKIMKYHYKTCTYCSQCGSFEIFIYIYIKYLYAKFTCLRYAHILFSVLKMCAAWASELTVL